MVISLKLAGSPWSAAVYNSGKSTIQARLIIIEVARILATFQWRFAINVNFTGAADSFFFQWCPNLDLEDIRYCALILSRYDRLRLLQVPSSLTPTIKECVNKFWYLQLLKQREYHGTTEFKLGGCPWWADGNDAIESRYFISCLIGTLKMNGWEVCGTMDLSRHNNDKSTFLLRQASPQMQAHMCISFNKTNRIRLIVSSSDISEESELQLTTRMNETIKQHWVALGPRNYGKSIEWKLEGDPWDTEGLYSDQTRGVYLLCLLLEVIQPLGWRLVSSTDVSSKNLDPNERGYSLVGKPEDLHTWFFLFDPSLKKEISSQGDPGLDHQGHNKQQQQQPPQHHHHHPLSSQHQQSQHQLKSSSAHDLVGGSSSVPNLDQNTSSSPPLFNPTPIPNHASTLGLSGRGAHYDGHSYQQQQGNTVGGYTSQQGHYPNDMVMIMGGGLIQQQNHSRSVPSVASLDHHLPSFSQQNLQQQHFQQSEQHMLSNQHQPQHSQGGLNLHTGGKHFSRGFDNGSIPTLHHEHPTHASDFHFNGRNHMMRPSQHLQQQQTNPCMANGRCQTRQRQLMRQASAGSLPPESFGHFGGIFGGSASAASYHQVPGHNSQMNPGARIERDPSFPNENNYMDEGGYKSDGEGYKSDGYGQMFSHRPNRRDLGTGFHPLGGRSSRSNGYVSDGEGYIIQSSQGHTVPNKRLSKSGRFGSQSSFQRYPHDADLKLPRSDLIDDDDQDIDEIHPRSHSRTPDTDDNLGVGPHVHGLPGRFPSFQGPSPRQVDVVGPQAGLGGNSSCEELYAVEVLEQTTMTATVRRSNSNSGNNKNDTIGGGQRSQRGSRSNSRQGTMGGSSCSDRSVESQSGVKRPQDDGRSKLHDHSTRHASNTNQRRRGSINRPPIDGYPSEGSNDSPMHGTKMDSIDQIDVVDNKKLTNSNRMENMGMKAPHGAMGSHSSVTGPSKRSGSRDRQCSSSKSLNNIERQESSASFQSGQSMHSTHSAPTGHPGGPPLQQSVPLAPVNNTYHSQHQQQQQQSQHQQQRFYNPQPRHMHHPNCQIASSSSSGGVPPPPGTCIESCSTQSSSSSASAPPDYATCSGIPPTYDQALEVPPKSQRRKWQQAHGISHPGPSSQTAMIKPPQQLQQQHHHHRPHHHQPPPPLPLSSASQQQLPPKQQPSASSQAPVSRKQKQSQGAGKNNELYYMGEFYG